MFFKKFLVVLKVFKMKLIIFTLLVIFSSAYAGWFSSLPCKCRLGNLNRIVNGQVAAVDSIPWIASLGTKTNSHFCGATILNKNWVLTAAHCTMGKTAEDITVRVGIHSIVQLYGEKIYNAKTVIQNELKNPGDFGDFALIEVDRPIEFEDGKIEPGCLNLKDENFSDDLLSAGWGITSRTWKDISDENGVMHSLPYDTYELKYYFSTQTKEDCKPHDICIDAKNKGDSACNGDSGGPLMHTKNGKTSVVGMAGFVTSKVEDDKIYFCNGQASYSRVKMYKDLIKKHAGEICTV